MRKIRLMSLGMTMFFCFIFNVKGQINIEEPEFVGNFVFVNDSVGSGLRLERQDATIKVNGFVQYTSKFVVNGCCSSVAIDNKPLLYFVVRVTDNSYDPSQMFVLYKLKKEKNKRTFESSKMGISGVKAIETGIIPFNGKKYKKSSYSLELSSLEAGEYAFAYKNGFTFFMFSVK